MVKRLLAVLGKEFSSLHQAAFLLGASAFLAQILGLLRDRLLAGTFGASTELDVYYMAFRIPDLLYVGFASFVSITVLIPFILKRKKSGGTEAVRNFLSDIVSVFTIVMILMVVIIFILMPILAHIIAPGFDDEATDLLIKVSRLLLLSPLILGLSNLFGSITQSYRCFLAYTLSPVVYNVGIIIGIMFFYPLWGLPGLVVGVILGALAHLLIQLPSVYELNLIPRFQLVKNWKMVKEVILISLPRTVTLSVHQLSLLVLISSASVLSVGAVSIFNLAFNLQSFPLIIIGVSYSVAAFPTLALLFGRGETDNFVLKIETAIRHIFFWSLPVVALLVVLRAHIVRVILGSGNFDWADTRLTAAALAIFVLSVIGQALVQLFVRAYYAAGLTKIPLLVNVFSSGLVIVFSFVFLNLFSNSIGFRDFLLTTLRVGDIENSAVLALPLAYSLGLSVNALIYWFLFQNRFKQFSSLVYNSLFKSFLAAFSAGGVAFIALQVIASVLDITQYLGVFLHGLIAGICGILAGLLILFLVKSLELAEIFAVLKNRVKFKPVRSDTSSEV